jgi:hypothetical protein
MWNIRLSASHHGFVTRHWDFLLEEKTQGQISKEIALILF